MVRVVVKQQRQTDWRYLVTGLRTDLQGLGREGMSFDAQVRQLDDLETVLNEREQYIDEKMRRIEDKAMKAIEINRQVKELLDRAWEELDATTVSGYEEPGAGDQHIRDAMHGIRKATGLL